MTNDRCVYLHLASNTRQVFYIGIGSKKRARDFKNRNRHWHKIVSEQGLPEVLIFAENLTIEDAAKWEKFWIRHHGLDRLVNISPGGDGFLGATHSDEVRKLISSANKNRHFSEETRHKISTAKKGVKRSDAARENISNGMKGKSKTATHKLKLSDPTVYSFKHVEHGVICCTRYRLRVAYALDRSGLNALVAGRLKSYKGWTLHDKPI
ncbi:putative homing endonuclease protein [Rhizobium phage RHph_X2_24]|nr:putative homing endonuclease protein [Rhizobium phage RHph_X2_24]